MWEAVGAAIKSFLEKRFIPTIAAVALTCLGLFVTPEHFAVLQKIGKPLYGILLFAVAFLLITFLCFLFQAVKNAINHSQEKAYYEKQKKENERENLEELWTYIDGLSPKEYEVVVDFLKSGNKPIQIDGYISGGLFSSSIVISSKIGAKISHPEFEEKSPNFGAAIMISQGMYQQANMYQLAPTIYNNLMYSVAHYDKISHFSRLTLADIKEDSHA